MDKFFGVCIVSGFVAFAIWAATTSGKPSPYKTTEEAFGGMFSFVVTWTVVFILGYYAFQLFIYLMDKQIEKDKKKKEEEERAKEIELARKQEAKEQEKRRKEFEAERTKMIGNTVRSWDSKEIYSLSDIHSYTDSHLCLGEIQLNPPWEHHGIEYVYKQPKGLFISNEDRFRHTYMIGKTGSGKTTQLKNLIAQDMHNNRSVILIAPENDIFNALLPYIPPERKDQLIYFDPTDTTDPVVGFNPFDFSEADSLSQSERDFLLTQKAGETYTALERAVGDLGVKMTTVVNHAVYALLQTRDASILDISRLLNLRSPDFRRKLVGNLDIDSYTREFWEQYDSSGYYRGADEPVINRFTDFFRPPLSTVLTVNSFSFDKILNGNHPFIFFANLSRLRGLPATITGQLLLATIQQAMLRRESIPERERRPVYMYIDEFAMYAQTSEQSLIDLFERARKYKVGLTIAHQVTADIPSKLLDVIVGNVGTILALQLAATDAPYFVKEFRLQKDDRNLPPDILLRMDQGNGVVRTPRHREAGRISFPQQMVSVKEEQKSRSYISSLIETSKQNFGLNVQPAESVELVDDVELPKKKAEKSDRGRLEKLMG